MPMLNKARFGAKNAFIFICFTGERSWVWPFHGFRGTFGVGRREKCPRIVLKPGTQWAFAALAVQVAGAKGQLKRGEAFGLKATQRGRARFGGANYERAKTRARI